jgi:asparagine synthase (glutamine-hydrolysing)
MVLAAMRLAGVERPRTFTISFKERRFDEGPTAQRIASHLGSDHTRETLEVKDLLALLPTYVDEYDEPFADSSAFATLAVSRLARRHVTVALTGDGADELFAGYHYYQLANRLQPILRWRPALRSLVALMAGALPVHRAKLFSGLVGCTDAVSQFTYLRSVSKDYPTLLPEAIINQTSSSQSVFAQYAADFALDLSPAETGMRLDAGITLPDLFLQKVDVASMAFSLEARCPMTDYRLVEWSMRLPMAFKLQGGTTKALLKHVLCRHLPREIVHRPKMGFSVPLAEWLRGPLKEWARELLYDQTLGSRLPLQHDRVRNLFEVHASGKRDAHPLLWSVLMLYCFIQQHCVHRALPELKLQAVA